MLFYEWFLKIFVFCILCMYRSWCINRKIGGNFYSESVGGRSVWVSFILKICYMFGYVRKKFIIIVRKDIVSVKCIFLMESRLIKGFRIIIY